jgi:hypothetical protein
MDCGIGQGRPFVELDVLGLQLLSASGMHVTPPSNTMVSCGARVQTEGAPLSARIQVQFC